ncbi:conserved hypothetical protein [Nostocoides japonicum T1-X7]|uniref:2-oxo-4-hydroxy-4-carboxy-5-ureidoimidazoline decarboxylase n=1 Tax=Nostocoides japonicum T1-X7 TaxID=1194083 RepID=A0A077LV74_9MICO|nr:2-oxo-4-hydroxy-4-carboxy-5-ureidoimidazoline decarboxylase [Tetrasphaera japonica]CCH77591.1 conserved hypothetical protein [Tetrasphaera japonica T1-X7]
MTSLEEFNALSTAEADRLLRPCVDIDRWVRDVDEGRPYDSVESLAAAAESAAEPFTSDEVEAALRHHPRIGERASGTSREASLSRAEQGGLDVGDDTRRRLEEGNRAYEERFGRVFLIRAAGRTSEEILAALQERLGHDPESEDRVVGEQLREIAVLRLRQAVTA